MTTKDRSEKVILFCFGVCFFWGGGFFYSLSYSEILWLPLDTQIKEVKKTEQLIIIRQTIAPT